MERIRRRRAGRRPWTVHRGRRRPAGISAGRSAGARALPLRPHTTTHDHDAISDADAVVADLSRVRARCTDDMIIIEID
jgi:hypothetical protein